MSSLPPPPPPRWTTPTKVGIGLGVAAALILVITFSVARGSDESPPTTVATSIPVASSTTTTTAAPITTTTVPPTTTFASTTTSSTSTTTSTTTTTTTTVAPGPTLLINQRAALTAAENHLWTGPGTGLAVFGLPDGEFRINADWWLVSTEPLGFAGCSGEVGTYVANPISLTILGLTPGWHGCAQVGGVFVVELHIHEVYANGIDLEWSVWERP